MGRPTDRPRRAIPGATRAALATRVIATGPSPRRRGPQPIEPTRGAVGLGGREGVRQAP